MFSNGYDQTAEEAITTVLNPSSHPNVATVKFEPGDISFIVEYINADDDSENFYNVCGLDSEETAQTVGEVADDAGLRVEEVHQQFSLIETEAETLEDVRDEIAVLAECMLNDPAVLNRPATTKHAVGSFRQAVMGIINGFKHRVGLA